MSKYYLAEGHISDHSIFLASCAKDPKKFVSFLYKKTYKVGFFVTREPGEIFERYLLIRYKFSYYYIPVQN